MSIMRRAGSCYLVTFVAGAMALSMGGAAGLAINAVATAAYVGVVVLFFRIFGPVDRRLAAVAAVTGLAGCAVSALEVAGARIGVNPLAIFGAYCLLVGILILESTFVPRVLGVLMLLGGLSWLTFGSPPLARALAPYNFAPGILGEGLLTIWLLRGGPPPAVAQ
ncbi:MAG: DUF4386 family protein [Vicinamibacterales bacterium]